VTADNGGAPEAGESGDTSIRIEVTSGSATSEELAAVVTVLQQTIAEGHPAEPRAETSRWQRAALIEGVGGKAAMSAGWGLRGASFNG